MATTTIDYVRILTFLECHRIDDPLDPSDHLVLGPRRQLASGLRDLWNDGKLAIVHACGMATTVTRSHFDAQLYIDLGTPGKYGSPTGWMTRAWETRPNGTGTLPALGVGGTQPAGLMGAIDAMTMSSPGDFSLNTTAWSWQRTRSDSPAGLRGVADGAETS